MDDQTRIQNVKSSLLCIQRFQWEQGCTAQAIFEYEGMSDEVIRLCKAAVLRANKDGRVGVMEKNESVDDPAAIGEALIRTAKHTGDPFYADAARKLYEYLKFRAPRTRDGILYHFNITNQVWVDAYYMAPPFLCYYGDAEEAMKQIKGFRKYLYSQEKHLLSHMWDDDTQSFAREAFWGVGNGWALAGLTRVWAMLDETDTGNRVYLEKYITELLDGCLNYQREDGLFHDVLDDPSSFVETNVGQMIAYTIYRGVMRGYLNKKYLAHADAIRAAAQGKVDELGFVQGVCAMPQFVSPGVAPEGQAFFILMEAAYRDLH